MLSRFLFYTFVLVFSPAYCCADEIDFKGLFTGDEKTASPQIIETKKTKRSVSEKARKGTDSMDMPDTLIGGVARDMLTCDDCQAENSENGSLGVSWEVQFSVPHEKWELVGNGITYHIRCESGRQEVVTQNYDLLPGPSFYELVSRNMHSSLSAAGNAVCN